MGDLCRGGKRQLLELLRVVGDVVAVGGRRRLQLRDLGLERVDEGHGLFELRAQRGALNRGLLREHGGGAPRGVGLGRDGGGELGRSELVLEVLLLVLVALLRGCGRRLWRGHGLLQREGGEPVLEECRRGGWWGGRLGDEVDLAAAATSGKLSRHVGLRDVEGRGLADGEALALLADVGADAADDEVESVEVGGVVVGVLDGAGLGDGDAEVLAGGARRSRRG